MSAESKKDTSRIILASLNIARIHYLQSDYTGAETAVTEIIPFLEKKKDHPYNFDVNLILGDISTYALDYKNALFHFNKALRLKKTTIDEKLTTLHNIGWVYLEMKQFKKATYIFEYLLAKKELSNSIEDYTLTLTNLGYCYIKLGKPKALDYYMKSLRIALKTNSITKIYTYERLSEYYKNKDFM